MRAGALDTPWNASAPRGSAAQQLDCAKAMPVIRDASSSRRRMPGLLDRLFHREVPRPHADPPVPQPPRSALIDSNTRTFWARGADAPATLVEARASAPHPAQKRLAALVDAHENGGRGLQPRRPRANPA